MERNQTGLNIKFTDIGYQDIRTGADLHSVKSVAGSLFHSHFVKSVCVYDADGIAHLYLRKMEDGSVKREER